MLDRQTASGTGVGLLLPWLSRYGRGGAWAALIGGAAVCVMSWFVIGGLIGLTIGICMMGLGAGILRLPKWDRLAGTRPDDPSAKGAKMPRDALLRMVPQAPRPGWVCGRCDVLYAPGECHGVCLHCDTSHQLYELRDEDDVGIALAALEPS